MLEDPLPKYAETLAEGDPYTAMLAAILNGVQAVSDEDEESGSRPVILWPGC